MGIGGSPSLIQAPPPSLTSRPSGTQWSMDASALLQKSMDTVEMDGTNNSISSLMPLPPSLTSRSSGTRLSIDVSAMLTKSMDAQLDAAMNSMDISSDNINRNQSSNLAGFSMAPVPPTDLQHTTTIDLLEKIGSNDGQLGNTNYPRRRSSLDSLLSMGIPNVEDLLVSEKSKFEIEKDVHHRNEQRKDDSPVVKTILEMVEKQKAESIAKPKKKKSSPKEKNKPRPPVRNKEPDVKEYVVVTDRDVLLGRGGRSNHHKGNIKYREQAGRLREDYRSSQKDTKTDLAQMLVDWVEKNQGGRFLKLDPENDKWYIVTNLAARKKSSQALREHMTQEERQAVRQGNMT